MRIDTHFPGENAMPREDCQLVPSVVIKRCIELLTAEEREKLTATEFLRPFQEHGFVVGKSCRAMIERMLGRKGESLDHDALIAAADDFVACCDGSKEHAFDVLGAYTKFSDTQRASTARSL